MVQSEERPVPRLALTIEEAALSIGVSKRHFERHVMNHVRVTMCGRRRMVAIKEIERYLDERSL